MIYILERPLGFQNNNLINELNINLDYNILYKPTISNVKSIIDFLENNKNNNIIIVDYFTNDFILAKNVFLHRDDKSFYKLENDLEKLNDYLIDKSYIKCIKQNCSVEKCVENKIDEFRKLEVNNSTNSVLIIREIKKAIEQQHYEFNNWIFELLNCFKEI